MTTETLMDAIGLLPADLVTKTDSLRTAQSTRIIRWKRWAAMAACLVLVLGAVLMFGTGRGGSSMAVTQSPGAVAMDAPAEEKMEESALMDAAPAETEAPGETGAVRNEAGLTWPLTLSLAWDTGSVEVNSGNYQVSIINSDGTRENTIACGAYPPDANLEPVAAAEQVELIWAEAPDTVTVRCWKDTGEEGTAALKAGILTVDAEYPIYEITASWGDICTASYAVRLHRN